ncbi:MAG TPA: RDD family protein [Pseudomonadales bacterium]
MSSSNPSGASASLPPAPLWRRLAAMLYDSFLVFAIWIVVGFAVLYALGVNNARETSGELAQLTPLQNNVLFAAMFISAYLFFGFFWTHSGQTLGMQAWRIRVQNADGSAISWGQSLQRFCTAPFALLALGIGYLWMLFDRQRRTVPDIVSRSQVVKI